MSKSHSKKIQHCELDIFKVFITSAIQLSKKTNIPAVIPSIYSEKVSVSASLSKRENWSLVIFNYNTKRQRRPCVCKKAFTHNSWCESVTSAIQF